MTKNDVIKEINNTQDFYIEKLIDIISERDGKNKILNEMKEINFTSPTGTGKTVMMSKLINKLPDFFFVITTLSRGQLRVQVEKSLNAHVVSSNYIVFGLNEYTSNTILQKEDYEKMLPKDKKIIWLRDEGHIKTNRWQEILNEKSYLIINFSATNIDSSGIQCNFTHTMMLRTVTQNAGCPIDALNKLLEVKRNHKDVQNYNPCALFRVLDKNITEEIIHLCEKYDLKVINITDESFEMSELCKDDNEYDVIINKMKVTEGIDLRRCHVVYMDSKPGNESTVVQIIGRARRNALLWRKDIDIFSTENEKLLKDTRLCYVYYNIPETKIKQNADGELSYSLCDTISIERLKPHTTIEVKNGQLANGLNIIELKGRTGSFYIDKDHETGFNIVENEDFYNEESIDSNPFIFNISQSNLNISRIYFKESIIDFFKERAKEQSIVVDKTKRLYLQLEKICELEDIPLDTEALRKRFGIGNPNYVTSKEDAGFLYSLKRKCGIYYNPQGVSHYNLNRNDFLRYNDDYLNGKFDPFVDLISKDKNHINSDLINHISSIDIIKKYYYSKITNIICSDQYVDQIDINHYIYSDHPLVRNINSKGIHTKYELFLALAKMKRSFMKIPLSKWYSLIDKINTLEDLDHIDVKTLSLKELNDIFNLKIPASTIDGLINGNFPNFTYIGSKPIVFSFVTNSNLTSKIYVHASDFNKRYHPYSKIINDREIAIIGPDTMKSVNGTFIEEKPISTKIKRYCKFSIFISNRYKKYIENATNQCFYGHNHFNFSPKCNSCLGYCVEYYAKYLLYGNFFSKRATDKALKETKQNHINDIVITRACINFYREEMKLCFGKSVTRFIPSLSVNDLIEENSKEFIETVVKLGKQTAEFIESKMHIKKQLQSSELLYDPNLSANHLSALADFINEDTIIDVKCTNFIDINHIKQILAYHYLSTKRSDLKIRNLYIYDAVSSKYIYIKIQNKDQ